AAARPILSSGQRRLWFLDRLQPGDAAYLLPLALRVEEAEAAALPDALAALARRHQVLRTTLPPVEGEPVQSIAERFPPPLESLDMAGLARFLDAPFDRARAPAWRAGLLRREGQPPLLVGVFHHIVFDRWSIDVLRRDLRALCRREALPDLPVQYADFAH